MVNPNSANQSDTSANSAAAAAASSAFGLNAVEALGILVDIMNTVHLKNAILYAKTHRKVVVADSTILDKSCKLLSLAVDLIICANNNCAKSGQSCAAVVAYFGKNYFVFLEFVYYTIIFLDLNDQARVSPILFRLIIPSVCIYLFCFVFLKENQHDNVVSSHWWRAL